MTEILVPDDFELGLVASDLDGTLLAEWRPISPATIDAIHRSQREGIAVVPVTGRPIRWLQPIAEQIPDLGRVICLNGAVVYDIARAEVVSAHTIGHDDLVEVLGLVTDALPQARFAFETLGDAFIETGFRTHRPREARILESVDQLVEHPVVKILVSIGDEDSQSLHDVVDPLITHSCHASFSDSANGLVELAPAGITKAKTLESLCRHLGVAQESVLAFGDMPNDIEMLTWAGHGVAMGNALDSVKAAADAVTDSVEDDGVAHYLNAALDRRAR